jgi:integrase
VTLETTTDRSAETLAEVLRMQGTPLRVIMGILGHSTITLTANTYAHLMPELQADAAARMDRLLNA